MPTFRENVFAEKMRPQGGTRRAFRIVGP